MQVPLSNSNTFLYLYVSNTEKKKKKSISQQLQKLFPQVSYLLLKWCVSPSQKKLQDKGTLESVQVPGSGSFLSLPNIQALF